MELVTLVRAHLRRIGSTRGGGFSASKEAQVLREVADGSTETLRQLVISIASEHGEALDELTLERGLWPQNVFAFNVPSGNTLYSQPYADCEVFPALKVGTRYFKLEEIKRD